MSTDHVRFADWDAAYVVRALGSDDRRLYEAHLDECRLCRDAIADLAPAIGLLARVGVDRAESLLDAPGEASGLDPGTRTRVVARGRRDARRRRVIAWGAGIAAAAVLAVVVGFAVTTSVDPVAVPEDVVALQPVTDVPLSATVELTDVAWGTRIAMVCDYPPTDDPYAADEEWPYVLVVTSTDGATSELSSWRAGPGSTAHLDAGTALDRSDIASIEVRAVSDGRVLLRGEPGE
ncbi:hypothetical protein B1729_10780 [Microbacterium sp. B35-04]|uniref:hypothetical protein n=1 Tax=unclassified Microbacterium TaxID=2609290 RepID=UPI0013CFD156|nr:MULTISPECIES: hypothetical protein [unclassified Microbacterium]KAF2413233.1 hypothetical protein B1729_10780 [Microbacterium sp. B35-04]KAF2417384.1 hypothetical protein B2K11_12950 [Microbacterium sp. B35-30]